MIERRRGAILNVASTAAFQPGPGMAVYFATKAFVLSFTEALHEEWKKRGIRVTALCPGPTRPSSATSPALAARRIRSLRGEFGERRARGLDGLDKNRAVVIPGLLNKIGAASTRFVPRSLVRKIAGAIKY